MCNFFLPGRKPLKHKYITVEVKEFPCGTMESAASLQCQDAGSILGRAQWVKGSCIAKAAL